MPAYFPRWIVAVLVVMPLMMVIVPAAQLAVHGLDGPHASDPFSSHVLSMLGFYGAYAILAASFTSLTHTSLVRKGHAARPSQQVLLAAGLGAIAFVPQGLVFGREYWLVNLAAGAAGGVIYGLLVVLGRRILDHARGTSEP